MEGGRDGESVFVAEGCVEFKIIIQANILQHIERLVILLMTNSEPLYLATWGSLVTFMRNDHFE